MSGAVHPWVTQGLLSFGLITEEQKAEADRLYQEEWNFVWDDSNWWFKTAEIAWHNEVSWWKRFMYAGVPPVSWWTEWIRERRGW